MQDVIVVGAGVIGAAIAFQLARSGARVTVIDAAGPAAQASGASFGWINASFFVDESHFALRRAGIEAHHRLSDLTKVAKARFKGCLCWEFEGPEMDNQARVLRDLGYAVEEVDPDDFSRLEPNVSRPPVRCLRFPGEGAVDAAELSRELLHGAAALGARLITGVKVDELATGAGRICGVNTGLGMLPADQVVVAAGTGSSALLSKLDVAMPMLRRPGLIMQTKPLPPLLNHILVAPGQELRQKRDGRIVAPTAASHQGDSSTEITERPDILADLARARVQALIPGAPVEWDTVTLAMRPVPQDGRPVIGRCGPDGLYVATMHSGVTLAAIVGELVAAEVLETRPPGCPESALLTDYRPQRFAAP